MSVPCFSGDIVSDMGNAGISDVWIFRRATAGAEHTTGSRLLDVLDNLHVLHLRKYGWPAVVAVCSSALSGPETTQVYVQPDMEPDEFR